MLLKELKYLDFIKDKKPDFSTRLFFVAGAVRRGELNLQPSNHSTMLLKELKYLDFIKDKKPDFSTRLFFVAGAGLEPTTFGL
ncbi:MAG: hypothetical protein ACYC49_09895 [Ignavibacteriaceae bacterium]